MMEVRTLSDKEKGKVNNRRNAHSAARKNAAVRSNPPTANNAGQNFTVIKGERAKNRKNSFIRAIVSTIIILAVIITLLYLNTKSPGGIVEWSRIAWASMGSGEGYPVTESDRGIKSVYMQGGNVLTFTDTSLTIYNKNGKQIRNILHGYTTPAISVTKTRTLIYDRGANVFRVDNNYESLFEKKTDNPIITADMAENGTLAVITTATGYSAEMKIFNKNFIEKSSIYISGGDVTSVCVCKDGKHIVLSTVNASGGYYRTTVSKYDLSGDKPVSTTTYDGTVILSIKQMDNGNFLLIGDNLCVVANDKLTELNSISYEGEQLSDFDVYGSQAVLLLGSSMLDYKVVGIAPDGKEQSRKSYDTEISAVLKQKNQTYVLKSEAIDCLDESGNVVESYECMSGASYLAGSGNGVITVASVSSVNLVYAK